MTDTTIPMPTEGNPLHTHPHNIFAGPHCALPHHAHNPNHDEARSDPRRNDCLALLFDLLMEDYLWQARGNRLRAHSHASHNQYIYIPAALSQSITMHIHFEALLHCVGRPSSCSTCLPFVIPYKEESGPSGNCHNDIQPYLRCRSRHSPEPQYLVDVLTKSDNGQVHGQVSRVAYRILPNKLPRAPSRSDICTQCSYYQTYSMYNGMRVAPTMSISGTHALLEL
jgi:hypothetical protein